MIDVVGLGPAGLDRLDRPVLELLTDPARRVIVRTLDHPAAASLAEQRDVVACDDLYEAALELSEVYAGIANRVIEATAHGDVVYAVPGSPLVGERSVVDLRSLLGGSDAGLVVHPGESFLQLALAAAGVDPLERGIQVLDAHRLPDPLFLHLPTLIGHVDRSAVLASVKDALGRVLDGPTSITVMDDLGGQAERVVIVELALLHEQPVGPRTTLFLDPPAVGWPGLVEINRILRAECPWDRRQTHHSLVQHLVEEAYEAVEAISRLPADAPGGTPNFAAYAEVEEELGDLLLQVVFHATLARESAGFDVEEVAEGIRRKLVRRHPHVFGDVEAHSAEEVLERWDVLKQEEKRRDSLMDGVPASLPALLRAGKFQRRAASVGFDWTAVDGAIDKVVEEAEELRSDIEDSTRAEHELGDLLFSVVNVARHLGVDPELALRQSADRFAMRFRTMESEGSLEGLSLEELDARWDSAKRME
jgi:tetrapyrrole methylase family protein/MazG family protein